MDLKVPLPTFSMENYTARPANPTPKAIMTNECAICYVSDINFLLPSLISAAGLRKYVPADKADIYVFLIDQEARARELAPRLAPYAIRLLPLDSRGYSGFDAEKFHQTGIPTSALGRFFVEGMLPNSCRRFVYLDGDTWVRRDPSALIEAMVPEGKFAAAEDIMTLRATPFTSHGRFLLSYFKGIGLDRKKNGYFNSGVFAASRKTWRTVSEEAFTFFKERTSDCLFHDQSALNAIVGDRRLRLSTRWNFQTPYRYLNVEQAINPSIYHFTQYPKPWMGPCAPWQELYPQYESAMKPFATLDLPVKKIDEASIARHNRLNPLKKILLAFPPIAKTTPAYFRHRNFESSAWL